MLNKLPRINFEQSFSFISKRISLYQQIGITFILASGLAATLGTIATVAKNQRADASRAVLHTYEVLQTKSNLFVHLEKTKDAQKGFAITKNQTYLDQYYAEVGLVDKYYVDLKELVGDNDSQYQRVQRLENVLDRKIAITEQIVELRLADNINAIQELLNQQLADGIDQTLNNYSRAIEQEEYNLLKIRQDKNQFFSNIETYSVFGVVILIFLVLANEYIVIIREFELRKNLVDELAEAKKEKEAALLRLQGYLKDDMSVNLKTLEPNPKLQEIIERLESTLNSNDD